MLYTKDYLKSHPNINFFIYGHRHIELDLMLNANSRIIIWVTGSIASPMPYSTANISFWKTTLREKHNYKILGIRCETCTSHLMPNT